MRKLVSLLLEVITIDILVVGMGYDAYELYFLVNSDYCLISLHCFKIALFRR